MLLNRGVTPARKERKERRPLTPEEMREASRLRAIYESKKKELRLTQESLAALMGFSVQSSVSQYMRGKIPISNEVLIRFAHHLGFDPREVRPDIFERLPVWNSADETEVPAKAVNFGRRYARLSDDDQALLEHMLERFEKRRR